MTSRHRRPCRRSSVVKEPRKKQQGAAPDDPTGREREKGPCQQQCGRAMTQDPSAVPMARTRPTSGITLEGGTESVIRKAAVTAHNQQLNQAMEGTATREPEEPQRYRNDTSTGITTVQKRRSSQEPQGNQSAEKCQKKGTRMANGMPINTKTSPGAPHNQCSKQSTEPNACGRGHAPTLTL